MAPRTSFFRLFTKLRANTIFGSMSRKNPPRSPTTPTSWLCLKPRAWNTNRAGYRAANKRIAEVLEQQSKRVYVDPATIASYYGTLDDKDKAFFWLEKAFAEKSDLLRILKTSRAFDSLRSDPRYKDLLRRMNLPQ